MSDAQEKYQNELLAVMWRWSQESDLTMAEWLEATHEAIETVLMRKE